jgi:hypothetical protein
VAGVGRVFVVGVKARWPWREIEHLPAPDPYPIPEANTGEACPNCKRVRVMRGEDGNRRCEKCAWCIEEKSYDPDLVG